MIEKAGSHALSQHCHHEQFENWAVKCYRASFLCRTWWRWCSAAIFFTKSFVKSPRGKMVLRKPSCEIWLRKKVWSFLWSAAWRSFTAAWRQEKGGGTTLNVIWLHWQRRFTVLWSRLFKLGWRAFGLSGDLDHNPHNSSDTLTEVIGVEVQNTTGQTLSTLDLKAYVKKLGISDLRWGKKHPVGFPL